MKITIEKEFTSAGEAAAWLQRIAGSPVINVVVPPTAFEKAGVAVGAQVSDYAKPPRKPRSDAGQKRGPHGAKINGEASLAPKTVDGSTTTSTIASPPKPAAPPAVAQAQEVKRAESPAAAAALARGITVTQLPETPKDALRRLNAVKGKGMDACIDALKSFGVTRVSDLPAEKNAEFIAYINTEIDGTKLA